MNSNANRCWLLFDVGGTFLKSVVATSDSNLLSDSMSEYPMPSSGTREQIEETFARAVAYGVGFASKHGLSLSGIGLAIPGPFDYVAGIPRMTHKFKSIYGVNLRDLLHAQSGVPANAEIVFMQDVNAAMAGEICCGNATGYHSAALVSLGTGLGFALSVNGKVLCSPTGGPAEVIYNRPYRDGVLEDYVSKRGFLRIYGELSRTKEVALTVADLGRMANEGDELARKTFAEVGGVLAASLHDLLAQYNTECLLFGGQISKSFRWMETSLLEGLGDLSALKKIAAAHIEQAAFYGVLGQFNAVR